MASANDAVNAGKAAVSQANIVYVFDENYAAIGGTSITSLFENNKDIDDITVYILTEGFSEENEKRFAQLAQMYDRKIVCMDVSEKIEEYKSMGLKTYRGSYVPYLKVFFPDYFPEIDRMVYIDADTVILRSIAPLLDSNALLRMVEHSASSNAGSVDGYHAPYNSVILAYNAKRWREENWSAKAIEFLRRKDAIYLFMDEGILNTVCRNEIEKLPLEYAFDPIFLLIPKNDLLSIKESTRYYTPEEISHAYDEPAIIHMNLFFGEKPWQVGNMHPAKEYFDTWLARSLWKDYVRTPRSTSAVFSVEKWLYRILPKRLFYKLWIFSQKYCVIQAVKRAKAANSN